VIEEDREEIDDTGVVIEPESEAEMVADPEMVIAEVVSVVEHVAVVVCVAEWEYVSVVDV
jgi:hypothetical protein